MRFAAGWLCGIALVFGVAAALDVQGLPAILRDQASVLWPRPAAVDEPAVLEAPANAEPEPTITAGEPPVAETTGTRQLEAPRPPADEADLGAPVPTRTPGREFEEPHRAIEDPVTETTAGTEFIWQAFRSEMSARGFARRLEAMVDHRLEVQKAAPGRYLVGFHYESATERESVLQALGQFMETPP